MIEIVAEIAGRKIARSEVLAWEDCRIDAAAKKLRVPAPPRGPVEQRREAFLSVKQTLGTDEILRRLAGNSRVADKAARAAAALSDRRRFCVTDLYVPGATAARFVQFFELMTRSSNEAVMLRACPDHFVIRTRDGVQEVLETTGGSPLATRFTIDYKDVSTLVTPCDPAFPYRLDGVARASNGRAVGGVRHQFRDDDAGVHARLCVEFPLPSLPSMIYGHCWHLACEFSNWFEAENS